MCIRDWDEGVKSKEGVEHPEDGAELDDTTTFLATLPLVFLARDLFFTDWGSSGSSGVSPKRAEHVRQCPYDPHCKLTVNVLTLGGEEDSRRSRGILLLLGLCKETLESSEHVFFW